MRWPCAFRLPPSRAAWLPLVLLVAPSVLGSSASGPDDDGAFVLTFDVDVERAGNATLALDVERDDAGDVERGVRLVGTRWLDAGPRAVDVAFLPAEGAGDYAVTLLLDDAPRANVTFRVEDDGGSSTTVSWDVPDEPTSLTLTDDAVNADGKTKNPGEALLTRATIQDANGLADLTALRALVLRNGSLVAVDEIPLPQDATSANVEHRFTRSPLASGAYLLVLRAQKGDAVAAEASRTFVIRDVAPTAALALPDIVPDEERRVPATVQVADRNGVAPDAAVEVRLYRGSTRVEPQGFQATLGPREPLADENGSGRASHALTLRVPAGASPGSYRASVLVDGTLATSAPFQVLPLPRLASVEPEATVERLRLLVNVTHAASVRVELTDGSARSTVTRALGPGITPIELDPVSNAPRLAWNVTLRARPDGPALDAADGEWRRDAATPPLLVRPLRPLPRTPAIYGLGAEGWDLDGANATLTLARWDGVIVDAAAQLREGRLRVDAPALAAGRYQARLVLQLPNGTLGEATWDEDVAPWVRVTLGNATVSGREARVPVRNDGGVALRGLLAEADGARVVALETAGGTLVLPRAPGERVKLDATLAVGEEALLVLRLPDAPLRAGAHGATVRVLAMGERPR